MNVTYQEVEDAVASWSIKYREAGYDSAQLLFLTEEYFEDMQDEQVSSTMFQTILKIVRKRCKYFPKVPDILEAKEIYCRNPERYDKSKVLQIAATSSDHDLTPEEEALSNKLRELAVRAVTGKMSKKKSIRLQEELIAEKKKFTGRLRVVGE